MLFPPEGLGASMLDILKDYQALIAGLLGFGAVVWSIQNAKSNILSRIKSDDAREKRQRHALEVSAYEYYINASQKIIMRIIMSLQAIQIYGEALNNKSVSMPYFSSQFDKIKHALERRPAHPKPIDSDLAVLYPLLDSETRSAISAYLLFSDPTDNIESMLLKELEDIISYESDIWGDDEREAAQETIYVLIGLYFAISLFSIDFYNQSINKFIEEIDYSYKGIDSEEFFFNRQELIVRLADLADEVSEVWDSDNSRGLVEAIRELRQEIDTERSAPRQRSGLFNRKIAQPRQFPSLPHSVLMAASNALASASLHHGRKPADHLHAG